MRTFFSGIMAVLVVLALFPLNSHSEHSQPATLESKQYPSQRLKRSNFFLIRLFTRKTFAADSVIQSVETLWNTANNYYSERKFLQASETARQIIPSLDAYHGALKRVHKKPLFENNGLTSFIRFCDVYNSIYPSVVSLTKITNVLPSDEDQIMERNRHELLLMLTSLHKEIRDTLSRYPQDSLLVLHAYRYILSAAQKVDTLLGLVYNQQRLDFSLKNRFYYNRMQESNNPEALNQFVADCDYYGVDKEWCERARKTLHPDNTATTNVGSGRTAPASSRKLSKTERIYEQYTAAVSSRNVDQLEAYIKKYSSKKYKKIARIDSARALLNRITKDLQLEKQFASEHPYFSDGSANSNLFKVSFQGLQNNAVTTLQPLTDSFAAATSSLRSLRFPALLTIDYSTTPPLYLLNCYIHDKKDMTLRDSSGQWYSTIDGIAPAFAALDLLTRNCTAQLKRAGVQFTYSPVFAVRVLKNSMNYLTMYACAKNPRDYDVYNFYDITVPGFQNVRIVNNSATTVIKIPEDNGLQENRAARQFFGK
ncbi:MAG: hypothetical protein JW915_20160 [Chitinispirillaceae bacterium]|nr:hypothetical protein [Chitinispirillaceae bacterium]